jgi:hypothetical protein
MTDRLKGFIVTLEEDLRTDDAEPVLNAIRTLRGVQSVTPMVTEPGDYMARQRVRLELTQQLWDVLHPDTKKR